MGDSKDSWINDDILHIVLNKSIDISKGVPIIDSYEYKAASQTGENFSSLLYRLKIIYHIENEVNVKCEKSYIVKCMQSIDTDIGKMTKSLGLFDRETAMYGETLIKIQETLKSVGVNFRLIPKLYHIITEPVELLIIEDLKESGYEIGDRLVGFDYEHCEMIMKNLAQMHAASIYLNKQNSQFRRHYNVGAFNPDMPESMTTYFQNGVNQALEVMKQRPNCRKYVKVYEEFSKRLIEDGIKLLKPVPEDYYRFNVLNHGDLWLNNIMFKYDEHGKPNDVRFIDFQMSFFGNSGLDMNYFFYTSVMEKIRDERRNDLLAVYHSSLVDVLKKLNYDGLIPTLEDVYQELLNIKDIGMMTICIVLPMVKLNKEESSKLTTENLINKDTTSDSRTSLYDNLLYQEALEVALKDLEKNGFIKADDN